MIAMTFESVHGAPRRHAARRIHHAAPRSIATAPIAVSTASNNADVQRSHDRIALIAGLIAIVALHTLVIAIVRSPAGFVPTPHKATELTIDIAPPPPPPPVIKPKPLPQIAEAKPIVRQPSALEPVVQSVTEPSAPSTETVQVAVTAPPAVPAPPVPVVEPVTEPHGYAGYLNNPAPVYPLAAQKHGLQGKVILKIHVLTSGQPDNVSIAKSSGYAILDEAAVKAVSAWMFEPARRGKTPIDGWVNVPINFNLS
jgi:protein TonB